MVNHFDITQIGFSAEPEVISKQNDEDNWNIEISKFCIKRGANDATKSDATCYNIGCYKIGLVQPLLFMLHATIFFVACYMLHYQTCL